MPGNDINRQNRKPAAQAAGFLLRACRQMTGKAHPRMAWIYPIGIASMHDRDPFGTPQVDPRHAWMPIAGTSPLR